MILDFLPNLQNYSSLHSDFKLVSDFLINDNLYSLPEGKHELRDDKVFVVIDKCHGRKKEDAKLEAHRKYIDIQLVLAGTEIMGWKPTATCKEVYTKYNSEKDIMFFGETPDSWITVKENMFAIFFPEDAHLPLVSEGIIHKAIAKIAVS